MKNLLTLLTLVLDVELLQHFCIQPDHRIGGHSSVLGLDPTLHNKRR